MPDMLDLPGSTGVGPVVLIADEDTERRRTLMETVLHFDPAAEILEARNGDEVIAHVTGRRPAIGFVGMKLDGPSGPEAVAIARKRGIAIPCLVLVAPRVFPQWQELAQSLNAYEVLKTPLDPDHIGSLLVANAGRLATTTVLLASSSEAARGAVARVLDRCGFALDVTQTDNGRDALRELRTGGHRLAFVDTNLAGLDGLELACQAQSFGVETSITLMTTGDPEPIALAARVIGVDFVMRMPFYARDIDLAIHHALGLRRPYLLHALTAPPAPTALLRVATLAQARRSA